MQRGSEGEGEEKTPNRQKFALVWPKQKNVHVPACCSAIEAARHVDSVM